jgi:hypothetical protein
VSPFQRREPPTERLRHDPKDKQLRTLAHSPDRKRLLLTYVGFDRVEFAIHDAADEFVRQVSVMVGTGNCWYEAVRFPHVGQECGLPTGDEEFDGRIRLQAAEELVRLEAAAAAPRAAA